MAIHPFSQGEIAGVEENFVEVFFADPAAAVSAAAPRPAAGAAAGLKKRTADNYVKLLEALFLVYRLPAWGKTLRARAAALPKLHVVDSGLAARLLRLTTSKLARRDATALQQFGHLLETFAVGSVIAFEVKAGSRIDRRGLGGLRTIRDTLGDAFVAGAVLHTGERSYLAEDRIYALPVDRLWQRIGVLQDR